MNSSRQSDKSNQPKVPYHSLFPLPVEACESLKKGELNYLSDHLPLITSMNVSSDQSKENDVVMITWNTLVPNKSGFQLEGFVEDEKFTNLRAKKIFESIGKMLRFAPDFFIIQEGFFAGEPEMLSQLNDVVKQRGYELLVNKNANGQIDGKITIYNNEKFSIENRGLLNDFNDGRNANIRSHQLQQTAFRNRTTDARIIVHNVHFDHLDTPYETDQYIKKLMEKDKAYMVIVAGDFNNRIVCLGEREGKNTTNTVVPFQFRIDYINMQGCDFTDGFFYCGSDKVCHQTINEVLNPFTGEVHASEDVNPLYQSDKYQAYEIERQRPALSCANEWPIKNIYDPVTAYLTENGIKVSMSTNALNQRRICFNVPMAQQKVSEYLSKAMTDSKIPYTSSPFKDSSCQTIGQFFFIPEANLKQVESLFLLRMLNVSDPVIAYLIENEIKVSMSTNALNQHRICFNVPMHRQKVSEYLSKAMTDSKIPYTSSPCKDSSFQTIGQFFFIPKANLKQVEDLFKDLCMLDAFLTIYTAIVVGSMKNIPYNHKLDTMTYIELFDYVTSPDRKEGMPPATAWALAKQHYNNCNSDNLELFNEIYKYSYKHCSFGTFGHKAYLFIQPASELSQAEENTIKESIRNTKGSRKADIRDVLLRR